MDVARIMSQPLAIEVASTESPQDAGASPEASAEPAPQAPDQAESPTGTASASQPQPGAPPAAADQDADADEPGRSGPLPGGGGDGERRLRGPLGRRRRGRGERPPREPVAAETREPESALPLADGENLSVAAMP